MKTRCLIIGLVFISVFSVGFSQTMVITDDPAYSIGATSSVLDIKSTSKGVLIPRLTLSERNLVSSPAPGLLIYQTDNTSGFYYYNGSDWTIVGPAVDGSETKVSAGTNVTVTGSGTTGSPYVVNSSAADGSETKVDAGTNVTITGAGTSSSHYIINSTSANGSETIIDAGTNVTVTGSGTSASHYVIGATGGDGSETKVDAGTNVTVTGAGTSASHYVINATGGNGSETKINVTGPNITKSGTGTTGDPYVINYNNYSVTKVQRDALSPSNWQYIWCSDCGTSGEFQVFNGITWTTPTGGTRSLAIGESYQGGKVAYIFQSGDPGYVAGETHGIIAGISDLSNASWGCDGTPISGADGTALGTGLQNTSDIVTGCPTSTIAAKLCFNYTVTENGVIYNDWCLPSTTELGLLYTNRTAIGGFTTTAFNSYYFTSSEYSSMGAYTKYFYDGSTVSSNKVSSYRVRAIRYF